MRLLLIALLCLPAFAQRGEPLTTHAELFDHGDGRKTVRAYSQPVFYQDGEELRPIELSMGGFDEEIASYGEMRPTRFRNSSNTLVSEITVSNAALIIDDAFTIRPLFVGRQSTVSRTGTARSEGRGVAVDGLFANGITVEYEPIPGGIKETVTVPVLPRLDNNALTLTWEYSGRITPELVSDFIQWGPEYWSPPPVVIAATGRRLKAHYALASPNLLRVVIDDPRVADAESYPLSIDPTVQSDGGDVAATRTVYTAEDVGEDEGEKNQRMYFQIVVPEVTLDELFSATINLVCTSVVDGTDATVAVVAYYLATGVAFTNSTEHAALDALSFGTTIGTANFSDSTGTKSLDITAALDAIYDGLSHPAPVSFKIVNDAGGADATATKLELGQDPTFGDTESHLFFGITDPDHPYIEMEYSESELEGEEEGEVEGETANQGLLTLF